MTIRMVDIQYPTTSIYGEQFTAHNWQFIVADSVGKILETFNRHSEAEAFIKIHE